MRSQFGLNSNRRSFLLLIALGGTALLGFIPLRLAISLHQVPTPQAVLVLEGNSDRVRFAAQFAKSRPTLPIWVSGNPKGVNRNRNIFRQVTASEQQIYYDFCATDTVTNFTCNVETFVARNIQHVYLITSDYHMERSLAIAALVFGSRGIVVTPVPVSSEKYLAGAPLETVRDCIRSIVWIMTGWTGADLKQEL